MSFLDPPKRKEGAALFLKVPSVKAWYADLSGL
jgi:hypothetical protein